VKDSHALGGGLPVGHRLQTKAQEEEDNFKPLGWEAVRRSDQLYLVRFAYKIFSWEKGSGEGGYFFLVDLENEGVKNVTNDYEQTIGPLSPPYRDVKEIPEKLMQKLREDEKVLSGK
jgi:hypothetical protein